MQEKLRAGKPTLREERFWEELVQLSQTLVDAERGGDVEGKREAVKEILAAIKRYR